MSSAALRRNISTICAGGTEIRARPDRNGIRGLRLGHERGANRASMVLAGRVSERWQIGAGFAIMGTGIALLATARTTISVFAAVGLTSSGLAIVSPNLSALISKGGGKAAGAALGIQSAASSLGQAAGPVLGSALFVWRIGAPFWFAGASMAAIALAIARKGITDGSAPSCPPRHRTLCSVSPMAERVARSHSR